MVSNEYVEERGGYWYVAVSRVSLASVIYAFREGASPETIRQNFQSLSLAQVYGAIAFYLNQPEESESYLRRLSEKWKEMERGGQVPGAGTQKRLAEARERLSAAHR